MIKKLFRTFALIVMSLAVQTARGAFVQPESLPTDSWANHQYMVAGTEQPLRNSKVRERKPILGLSRALQNLLSLHIR